MFHASSPMSPPEGAFASARVPVGQPSHDGSNGGIFGFSGRSARIAGFVTSVALTILFGSAALATGNPFFFMLTAASAIGAVITWPFSCDQGHSAASIPVPSSSYSASSVPRRHHHQRAPDPISVSPLLSQASATVYPQPQPSFGPPRRQQRVQAASGMPSIGVFQQQSVHHQPQPSFGPPSVNQRVQAASGFPAVTVVHLQQPTSRPPLNQRVVAGSGAPAVHIPGGGDD